MGRLGLGNTDLSRRHVPHSVSRRRAAWPASVLALSIVGVMLAITAPARAADCALADFAYNGACGPQFESPAWGDAAGWTDPSKYSTIQLSDILGYDKAELVARGDDGIEIWTFDTTVGQWRPAIGADGLPEVLSDFHSPLPNQDVRGSWRDPAAFSTIQVADVNGDAEREIVGTGANGTEVWHYAPPTPTGIPPEPSINGGTWSLQSRNGNLPSSPPPSRYLSEHVVDASPAVSAYGVLTEQSDYWTHGGFAGFQPTGRTTLAPFSSDPAYYLNNMSGLMPAYLPGDTDTSLLPANVYRTPNGVGVQQFVGGNWVQLGPPPAAGSGSPFADQPSSGGNCSGPSNQSSPCFGSNPAYYETMKVATNLLGRSDESGYVLGRLRDGLHVWALSGQNGTLAWNGDFPVLTALADPSTGVAPQSEWASIRTGDVTGDGQTDVLALVNGQLQAWELDSNGSGQLTWNELPASAALNLGGSAWQTNASYYSTLEVGPVAGPSYPDGVIARGPFGIRTWFYCSSASQVPGCASLQGQSGWTSWQPQDLTSYPQFAGGQAAAWTELNTLARNAQLIGPASTSTVRDTWTAATPPTDTDLSNLRNGLNVFVGCTGQTSANPPTYSSCAVPAGSSGFTAADWTAVVNETLAETYYAGQTNDFFAQLTALNSSTFLAKEAELPAIGDSIAALGVAAGDNATSFSPEALWSTGLGIASAFAGAVNSVAGAALSIASYLAGLAPSASPTVTQPPFQTTLNGLQNDLANAVTEASKAIDAQSYQVRQSYGMMQLIAQLTGPSGPWHAINTAGLQGSMNQGFALWAYKQLLPTVVERDVISNCTAGIEYPDWSLDCSSAASASSDGSPPNFTYINQPHTTDTEGTSAYPCWFDTWEGDHVGCHYDRPPNGTVNGQPGTDIVTKVWGPLSDTCNFNGDPNTEWTFGCSLGIDPKLSTDAAGGAANGWNFKTCTASPLLFYTTTEHYAYGSCTNSIAAQATIGPTGSMKLTATAGLPAGFQVRSATLIDKRLLRERRGRGKLLTRSSGRALGTVRLARASGRAKAARSAAGRTATRRGDTMLASRHGAPPITLTVHRTPRRGARLTLRLRRVGVKVPYSCQRLPASTSTALHPFRLEASLKLSNGHRTRSVPLHAQWKCKRGRGGRVTGMRTVAPPKLARHPGLAVAITGPRRVIPGTVATYSVRVHNNRRKHRSRVVSPLSHILVRAGLVPSGGSRALTTRTRAPRARQISQLRHGKTKVLHIPVRIPRAHVARVCVGAVAIADSARPDSARACAAVSRAALCGGQARASSVATRCASRARRAAERSG